MMRRKFYLVGDQKTDQFSFNDPQVVWGRGRIEFPMFAGNGLVTQSEFNIF